MIIVIINRSSCILNCGLLGKSSVSSQEKRASFLYSFIYIYVICFKLLPNDY